MTAKPIHPEVAAYAAGAAGGAAAMLLALLPHLDLAATTPRVSPTHVGPLQAAVHGQSRYAAAKIGLPPMD